VGARNGARSGTDGFYDAASLAVIADRRRATSETVQSLVVETLREAILEGVLPPGARLRQEDLAATFSSSRIPVREALHILEYEGLTRSEPRRGFTVTDLDADQIEEVYDLRIVLETHALRVAIPLLTDDDHADLQRLYDEMCSAEGIVAAVETRDNFYRRLYSVTARPRLQTLIDRLRMDVGRSLQWKLAQISPEHHQTFFDAVQRGDVDAAAAELTAHYRRVAALLRRFVREARQSQQPARQWRGRE
jgi:DNA-binding GntR family transcriptional regulator